MNPVIVSINGVLERTEKGTVLASLLTGDRSHMDMPCGGHGKCGKCRVMVAGEVSPPTDTECRLLTADELDRGVRLACLTTAEGNCTVTVISADAVRAIRADGDMPAVTLRPTFSSYGAAVDIGTTTLAARLYDTNGALLAQATAQNPQSAWGADVISRIEASMRGEREELAAVTCAAVDSLIDVLAIEAEVSAHAIDSLVLTGNTVMFHLLTATPTEPLSRAPFAAGRLFGETLTAGEVGLSSVFSNAEIYLPPCIAAFVGADTVTAMLAAEFCEADDTRLLVDIGTNGEMALWHDRQLFVCSTAAGPAFEGAGISMGMGGQSGAIDHVCVRDGCLDAHVIGDTVPRGICGSGIVDAVACLLETEALDETGYLEDNPAIIAPPVVLTAKDVRAVQLAKGAVHAGLRTLLHSARLNCTDVSTLFIAGGFGSYLDVANAGRIGLLPEELIDRVRVMGNAALVGASMLLLDRKLRSTCTAFSTAEVVDLSSNPVFTNEYMERMLF